MEGAWVDSGAFRNQDAPEQKALLEKRAALQKDIEARHGLPEDVAAERARKKRGLFGRGKGR